MAPIIDLSLPSVWANDKVNGRCLESPAPASRYTD